jgi:signal peptidase II
MIYFYLSFYQEQLLRIKIERKWYLFSIVSIVGFFLDWFTKYLAAKNLKIGEPVDIIGHYAQFVLVFNKGAIFGIEPRRFLPTFPLNGFFIVFTILAIIIIVAYYKTLRPTDVLMQWGISLVMPGALGNIFDRIVHARLGVVDFIRLGISENIHWFIFNCSDAYVTIGVILMLWNFIFEEKKQKPTDAPKRGPGLSP